MRRLSIVLIILITLLAPFAYNAIAQSGDDKQKDDTAKAAADVTQLANTNNADAKLPAIANEAPPESAYEKVDHLFDTTVKQMKKVLFYRVGASEQTYIQIEPQEFFIRDRNDKKENNEKDFIALDPAKSKRLGNNDLKLLAAQKKLIEGKDQLYRLGKIGKKKIEYITIKHDAKLNNREISYGNKYLLKDGKYHMVGAMRGLLSDKENEVLSADDVEKLALQKSLKVKKNSYILVEPTGGAPVVVVWLALGAVFFTIYMTGFNIWGFTHAIEVVRGKYDNPNEDGEVTHFQALASALSATVGLGNIAGVTIAMTIGGPGAFFWMLMCGLFGMTSKFVECTLGQKYRIVKPDGTILGGPMRYLKVGLAEIGLKPLGIVLSFVFTVMCILASFGGGNMFQANQSGATVLAQIQQSKYQQRADFDNKMKVAAENNELEKLKTLQQKRTVVDDNIKSFEIKFRIGYGIILAILVGVVILGGIKRIGAAAEKVVPTMCLMYVAACLWIIAMHITELGPLVSSIFTEAFNPTAMAGGLVGVLVVGVQRAAFSNEAGVGSASIAHSAAKTDEPVREGTVALLGPFIDTVVVCSMTALVILITNAWNNEEWIVDQGLKGAALTSQAFRNEISWFPWVLSFAVVMFAYSTIISWSYYGERCWEILFGSRSTLLYKILTVSFVFIGAIVNLGAVLDFSDMMILSMAFPNILGAVLLAPKVKRDLADYWKRYKAGEFKTYK